MKLYGSPRSRTFLLVKAKMTCRPNYKRTIMSKIIDQLELDLQGAQSPEKRIDTMFHLSNELQDFAPSRSKELFRDATRRSEALDYATGIATSYLLQGSSRLLLSQQVSAQSRPEDKQQTLKKSLHYSTIIDGKKRQ